MQQKEEFISGDEHTAFCWTNASFWTKQFEAFWSNSKQLNAILDQQLKGRVDAIHVGIQTKIFLANEQETAAVSKAPANSFAE